MRQFARARTIDEYDVTMPVPPRSRDVTDQQWWRHNVKSEKIVPSDNGEIGDRQLILAELCIQGLGDSV